MCGSQTVAVPNKALVLICVNPFGTSLSSIMFCLIVFLNVQLYYINIYINIIYIRGSQKIIVLVPWLLQ
jgi:hypothetical protein